MLFVLRINAYPQTLSTLLLSSKKVPFLRAKFGYL